jgi:four helix bundle protein
MQNHRELRVWQEAHALTVWLYKETRGFPKEEIYGLTSQIRRAAVSVEANLAEGCGRFGPNELPHFVSLASGSTAELDTELLLAFDLGYLPANTYQEIEAALTRLRRGLTAFHQRLTTNNQ